MYISQVVIKVNDSEIAYPMKLGEAGEAFFVFETEHEVPEEFQTSPLMQAADTSSKLGSSNEVTALFFSYMKRINTQSITIGTTLP